MTGDDKPRPILSPLFWAAIVFCLLCFAGAAAVVFTAMRAAAPLASTVTHATHPA